MKNRDERQEEKKSVRSLKARLLIILLYAAVLSTATYAWFTINNKPKATNLALSAGGPADLLIADDTGSGPGEYGDTLNLKEEHQMELNPVTTKNAKEFYSPVYSGTAVTGVKKVAEDELYKTYVYKKTFYLKAGAAKSGSSAGSGSTEKYYDIMLLGTGSGEANTGCVIKHAAGSASGNGATAANCIRIAFTVDGQEQIPVYEPNSSQHNNGDKAVNNIDYGIAETLKQPSEGGAFEGGENGYSRTLFTIKEEEDVKVTMLVWIEGTDDDCSNSIQLGEITGNIQFVSKDAESANR